MIPALLLAMQVAAPAAPPGPADDPRCATVRAAVPPGFGGWSARTPVAAGRMPATAPVLPIGGGADLRLAAGFVPAASPGKAPADGSKGGLALFEVRRAGTYRVGLSGAAWIDVVRRGQVLASSAHGHGPMCTGINKIVDYRLSPGRYLLQLTGAQADRLGVLIARQP